MSDLDCIGRRPFLAGIGAVAMAAFSEPARVRAQALDRPPSVLVFDVAESLLDLGTLRPLFERVFGDGAMVNEWFGETILYSESATLTNAFAPLVNLEPACSGCWAASITFRSARLMSPNSVRVWLPCRPTPMSLTAFGN
jgi:hypothetical protein